MSIKRKDVRGYLDERQHAAFIEICEHDGVTTAEFIEALLVPVIDKRVHDAIELADRLRQRGISRSDPENPPDQEVGRSR